jgi:CheY-like chemotaxis protein
MNISQVLVVDDDEAFCRIVDQMLSGDEYEVRATTLSPPLSNSSNKSLSTFMSWTTNYRMAADLMSRGGSAKNGVRLQSFLCRVTTPVPSL